MVKSTLTKIHRWVGFPLGVLFFVTLLSGIFTGLDDYLEMNQTFGQQFVELSDAELANHIEVLYQQHPQSRSIKLPTIDSPVFKVSMRGEQFVYSQEYLELLEHEVRDRNGFFSFMLRLHRNFLLGRNDVLGLDGNEWVAWVGLFATAISLLGVYLWWPHRRTFKLERLVPKNTKISSYYFSHLTSGVVCTLFIVLFALTGAAITYRDIAKQLFLNDSAEVTQAPIIHTGQSWPNAVKHKIKELEGATLVSIGRARSSDDPRTEDTMQFRYHTKEDWLGLAGSYVYVHSQTGAIQKVDNFGDLTLSEKLYRMIVPLHTGRGLTSFYLLSMLVVMTLSLIMVIAGITSFVRKKSKYEKKIIQSFKPRISQ